MKWLVYLNVIAADTNSGSERLSATSFFSAGHRNYYGQAPGALQPPVENMDGLWGEYEETAVREMMKYTFIGDREKLSALNWPIFQQRTQLDELMIWSHL